MNPEICNINNWTLCRSPLGRKHPSSCLQPGNLLFSLKNAQPDISYSSCCLIKQGSSLTDNFYYPIFLRILSALNTAGEWGAGVKYDSFLFLSCIMCLIQTLLRYYCRNGLWSMLASLSLYEEGIHPDPSRSPNTNTQRFLCNTVCKWNLNFLNPEVQHNA